MPSVKLELPYPPSVNRYWRQARGRFYIAAEGKAFRDACGAELLPYRGLFGSEQVRLKIALTPPDHRRRDLDNVLKALLDVLEYYQLFDDDAQVCELYLRRASGKPPGGVCLRVWQASPL